MELKKEFISPDSCGAFEGKIERQIMTDGEDLLFFY
jgi:hypothetical protein